MQTLISAKTDSEIQLYTYCLRVDDGAAPNPYWGICTLAICKPAIRRTAKVGDWVVGLGSANSPIGDVSHRVVYAMEVSDKRSLWGYDILCQSKYPGKIADWNNVEFRRRVGDCIYDYTNGSPPRIRPSVHNERHRHRDLSGENALMSEHFYYFGDHPVSLPTELFPLIHSQQGHKVKANRPYVDQFLTWIQHSSFDTNTLYGEPQWKSAFTLDPDIRAKCADFDLEDDDESDKD